MIDQRIKLIAIIAGAVAIVLIGFGFINLLLRSGKTEVNIVVYPEDSKVTINDQPSATGTIFLEPGEYTFKANHSGWKEAVVTQTITNEPATISLLPEPETTEALEWINNNTRSSLDREAVVGRIKDEEGRALYEDKQYTFDLPYTGPDYEITYNETDQSPNGIEVLIIATAPSARTAALDYLRGLGYDPSVMYIKYVGFNNPLQGAAQ